MMRLVLIFTGFVLVIGSSIAQQSLYLAFEGSIQETKAIQTLSKPNGNDPFKSIQSSLYDAISRYDRDFTTVLIDSTYTFISRTKGYAANTREIKVDEIKGVIVNFDVSQIDGEFISNITSLEVVVEYFVKKYKEQRRDTLNPMYISSEVCENLAYSFLTRSIRMKNEQNVIVKYLNSVFDGKTQRDIFGHDFKKLRYNEFKNSLTRIDTLISVCHYDSYEERIFMDTTTFKRDDFHPIYQSHIDFCDNPLQVSINHEYIGLARKAIDDVTGEFKYYWPTLYIKNERIE